MRNFESKNVLDILDNGLVIKSLHEKMEKRRSFYRPNPKDFIGFEEYNEEEINRELKTVEDLKTDWDLENSQELKKQKLISDILEGIIVDQFSGAWLSEKAEGHYTSEADDVLRGVDIIAELKEDELSHYLGFAIDITMAKDPSVLEKKLAKNWKDVETGKFQKVKYFEDADGNKTSLEPVKILIAVNQNFTRELVRLEYLNKKDKLSEHVFRLHLLYQIKEQLEAYYTYAKNTDNFNLMEKLHESIRIFYKIIEGKLEEEMFDARDSVENEEDFKMIRQYCNSKIDSLKVNKAA